MKLIVAGLPKTGTNSLAKGLQMLGYRVYDTKDNYTHFYEQWMRIMDRGGLPVDFRDMYHDIDASLDVPVVYYWEEILKAFPGTKVRLIDGMGLTFFPVHNFTKILNTHFVNIHLSLSQKC